MLTREIMGLLALGILWLNAGLVVAVACKQLGNVLALRRRLREAAARGELIAGRVERSAAGERFAVRRITQHGRAITEKGPDRILFTDGPQSFEVFGGALATDGGTIEVEAADPALSEVWIDGARSAEAIACGGPAEFERAWTEASTFKGHVRDVEIDVRTGDRVWVMGVREAERVRGSESTPLLVSMVDPIAFCGSRVRVLVGFVAASVIALAGVTAIALWPPHFGLVSTLGGALGVAYFLGIQPLGTAVRDAVKTPARRLVGGLWRRPEGERAAVTA